MQTYLIINRYNSSRFFKMFFLSTDSGIFFLQWICAELNCLKCNFSLQAASSVETFVLVMSTVVYIFSVCIQWQLQWGRYCRAIPVENKRNIQNMNMLIWKTSTVMSEGNWVQIKTTQKNSILFHSYFDLLLGLNSENVCILLTNCVFIIR